METGSQQMQSMVEGIRSLAADIDSIHNEQLKEKRARLTGFQALLHIQNPHYPSTF